MPILHKIKKRQHLKDNFYEEDNPRRTKKLDRKRREFQKAYGYQEPVKESSIKRGLSRMRSRAVQINDTDRSTAKKRCDKESSVYSDPEDEDYELDFEEWTDLLHKYFSKEATHQIFPLNTISKLEVEKNK